MPLLADFSQFQGLHWETGSLRNYLAYKEILAPHTNQPYTEAMLLGISGGITMGYFTFDYEGYDPMVRILTRNTFDPLNTIYQRLDIKTSVIQTSSEDKGVQHLVAELESGSPAIVVADVYSLPYNALDIEEGMWAMLPILVYGYDPELDQVWISDRSRSQLNVTTRELAAARSRTKKNKYRLLVHEAPDPDRLSPAVVEGLQQCVDNFTQPPPKGSKNNFGFLAYQKWIQLLQKPNQRGSWMQEFPPGPRMYAGLTSAFEDIRLFGKDGGADRYLYAAFLDEASDILSKPELKEIAQQFTSSAKAWDALADSLLPDEVPQFKETRTLMLENHQLFITHGSSALDEIKANKKRLVELKSSMAGDFPVDGSQAKVMFNQIADNVKAVQEIEHKAIEDLSKVISYLV